MAEKDKTKEKTSKTLKEQFLDKIKQCKETSKKRKFSQSWDLSIALKNLDLKKPENRFNVDFNLLAGKTKKPKILLFADVLATEGRKYADLVLTRAEIEKLVGNKKQLKKIANSYDLFLGEIALMPLIGKNFGAVLGTRGKTPRPVPPNVKIEPFIQSFSKNLRLVLRDTPVINISIGSDDMNDDDIAANAEAIVNFVKTKLPKGSNNMRAVYIKLTMGKPGKIVIQ